MRRGATPRVTGVYHSRSSSAPGALGCSHQFLPSGSLRSPPHRGRCSPQLGREERSPPPRRLMLRTGHCYLATAEGCGFNPTRYPAPSSPASFPEEWAQFPSELGSNWGIIFFPPLLSFFWSILLGCFRHTRCPASWSVLGWDESWLCHPMGKAAGSLG